MYSSLDVSVLIPVYKAKDWIEDCLLSLCNQTFDSARYEIITILNGPDDGSAAIIGQISKAYPSHRIRVTTSQPRGTSRARNAGIALAEGHYLSFVDADDWVSKRYLELLHNNASQDTVPVAQIVNVDAENNYDFHNRYNNLILGRDDPIVDPKQFMTPLSFIASKMIPTDWAREVSFDESLKSTEDVVFNYDLYSKYDFKFSMFPAAAGATYFRRTTAQSVSRGNDSRDFLVDQRLQAMSRIARARSSAAPNKKRLFLEPLKAQLKLLGTYLPRVSRTEKQEIIDSVSAIGITGLDWSTLQDEPKRLVIALNFVPYNDTGAIVAAKRIRERGEPVDVISNNMSELRAKQFENKLISEPYVRRLKSIQPSLRYFGSPKEIASFMRKGLETFKLWTSEGQLYEELYSRSMWPHSHLLAAAIKHSNPDLNWEAEFSDPNSLTVEGQFRLHPPVTQEIANFFSGWGNEQQQAELRGSPHVMRWAELLPYFFADTLTFTNRHQLEIMLEHAPEWCQDSIRERAVISAHPTLPAAFYGVQEARENASNEFINLAYFGDFYKTRGMTEVFDALNELPDQELSKFRLSIFTSSKVEDFEDYITDRVREIVVLKPKLNYLSFLGTLNAYDVLIVNDAHTRDYFPRNPYLPSKVSDYIGSDTPIWAVVEAGSILSTMVFAYQSELGNKNSALAALHKISSDFAEVRNQLGVRIKGVVRRESP